MNDQVIEIIATIFRLKPEMINDQLSIQDVDTWHSLTHMELIFSLEKKFDISFTGEEIAIMSTVGTIKQLVFKKEKDYVT